MSVLAASLALALGLQETLPPQRIPLADLRGLSPAEVGARIGAAPGVAAADALRIVDGGRTLDLYPMRRFWRQPATETEACLTGLEVEAGEGDTMERRRALAGQGDGLVLFEDGRLAGVYTDPTPLLAAAPVRPATARSLRAQMRAPRPPSPLTVGPGRLPLSDGAAVMERLRPVEAEAAVVALCRTIPERTYRSDPGMDVIWGLVGLSVLPFVPFQRAEDSRADREGGALLASVEAGADLGQRTEDWVGRTRGVRVYRDPADPDFAVIAIKLGSGDDTAAKVGLLGVRGTRVVWKAEREAADQSGVRALMCRDDQNRATDARPGCSGTGFLIP
jgi:hypothetical protein